MSDDQLHKLLGTVAEVAAASHPKWDRADTPAAELRLVREAYWVMADWCDSQTSALTELIEQHEQQAAAPLGK